MLLLQAHQEFGWIAKHFTSFTCHDMKFDWKSGHHVAFYTLKSALIEASILHYPSPSECYIVYTDASYDACGAQLSQKNNGQGLPVAFLTYTFTDSQ